MEVSRWRFQFDHFQQAAQTQSWDQCSDILLLDMLGEMLFAMLAVYFSATLYNRLTQLRHRADVPSNEQAQGPHFHVLLPGEHSVPRSSWCSAFSQDPSFPAPLLLPPQHQRAPCYTKGPSQRSKTCFQNPCFSALLLSAVKYLPWKKIHPFVIFLLPIKKLAMPPRWGFAPGKRFILNEVSACVYWWPLVAVLNC